jgi:hypothetical protein
MCLKKLLFCILFIIQSLTTIAMQNDTRCYLAELPHEIQQRIAYYILADLFNKPYAGNHEEVQDVANDFCTSSYAYHIICTHTKRTIDAFFANHNKKELKALLYLYAKKGPNNQQTMYQALRIINSSGACLQSILANNHTLSITMPIGQRLFFNKKGTALIFMIKYLDEKSHHHILLFWIS